MNAISLVFECVGFVTVVFLCCLGIGTIIAAFDIVRENINRK